jgi:GNAT superfamily N-acetyltransferase
MNEETEILIKSEAFPSNIKLNIQSSIHSMIKNNNIKASVNDIIIKSLTKDHIDEIISLHKEWFPVNYNRSYFTNILDNHIGIGAFKIINSRECLIGSLLAQYHNEHKFRMKKILPNRNCLVSCLFPYKIAYISTLGVIDEYRRLGLANLLVETFMKLVKDKCLGIYLHVIEHNNVAMLFYEKIQFVKGDIIKDYYIINNACFDARIFYRLFIN